MVEATLDYCIEFINDQMLSNLDCTNSVIASTNYRYCLHVYLSTCILIIFFQFT